MRRVFRPSRRTALLARFSRHEQSLCPRSNTDEMIGFVAGHIELLRRVCARGPELFEVGLGAELKRPEQRLRAAIVAALAEESNVAEVTQEWRPGMRYWPSQCGRRLGGFDLAIRFRNESSYSTVVELKWCQRPGLDAFDEVLWDAFKLAHAQA